jgi:prolyl 4-hydroxylase
MNHMPPDWQNWIKENIERGVPEQELVQILTKHKFARKAIDEAMRVVKAAPDKDHPSAASGMPTDWQHWVEENIGRGVPEEELVQILAKNNFDRMVIAGAIRGIKEAQGSRAAAVETPEESEILEHGIVLGSSNIVCTSDRDVPILMEYESPQIILFGNVLSPEECEQLIALATPKISRSTTVDDDSGSALLHENRTSSGTFFNINETAFIKKLDRRIAELMQLPVENGEGLQILNYRVGQEYRPHYDYFPPGLAGSAVHLRNGGQRVATLVLYLNNVEDGGETVFPELGLSIVPARGNAVYFRNVMADGSEDTLTLHGGAPVRRGEKWIATKWMRKGQYR